VLVLYLDRSRNHLTQQSNYQRSYQLNYFS
jgi:hypothetical protein